MGSVLSIQDLSCVGRCSLTVALPVISAMGHACSVLPTALLSTHTAFPDPYVRSLTGDIPEIFARWEALSLTFDTVASGYLSGPEQAAVVAPILRRCRERGSTVIVDPAMGDGGRLYRGLGADHAAAMAALCREADYLLPNLTEAALLTGRPYREAPEEAVLSQTADDLLSFGGKAVAITGVRRDGCLGVYGKTQSGEAFSVFLPEVSRSFHGTGDLFAAVFAGGVTGGQSPGEAAALAAGFVRQCVENTEKVTPFGVEFEKELPYLLKNFRN